MCPPPFGASSSSSRAQQAAAIWAAPSCACFSCFCIFVSRSASHAWLPRKRAGFACVPSLVPCSSRSRWLGGFAERLSSLVRRTQHPQRWRHTRTRRSARHLRRVGSANGVAVPVRLSKGRGGAGGAWSGRPRGRSRAGAGCGEGLRHRRKSVGAVPAIVQSGPGRRRAQPGGCALLAQKAVARSSLADLEEGAQGSGGGGSRRVGGGRWLRSGGRGRRRCRFGLRR